MPKPDITAILSHYDWDGRVMGGGTWQRTRCPFHGDRTPSASINEEAGVFRCHACNLGGDAYHIIMEREGVDFVEAKRRAEAITGERYDSVSGGTGEQRQRSKLPAWTRTREGSPTALSPRRRKRAFD